MAHRHGGSGTWLPGMPGSLTQVSGSAEGSWPEEVMCVKWANGGGERPRGYSALNSPFFIEVFLIKGECWNVLRAPPAPASTKFEKILKRWGGTLGGGQKGYGARAVPLRRPAPTGRRRGYGAKLCPGT